MNTPPVAGSRPIKYAPTFLGRVTETSNRITEAAGLETDLDPDSFRDPPQPGDLIYRRVSYAVAEETDPALLRWLGPLCSACLIDAEEPSWCEDRFVFDQCEGAFPGKADLRDSADPLPPVGDRSGTTGRSAAGSRSTSRP